MKYIETVEVSIDDPEDYPGNARIHDDAWLDESAKSNGQYRSIVARRLDGDRLQILAGHGTRAAFRRQGRTSIRIEVIDADDTEARRINLVDNPRPGIGGFDERLLMDQLDAANRDGGLAGTGWDDAAYRELLDGQGTENPFGYRPDGDPDDFDDTPPPEPTTQLGDVWLLGRHRLVCGDSTDPATWGALLLAGERLDCLWTDPPYGVAYVGKTADALTIENDDLDEAGLTDLTRRIFDQAIAVCRPGAAWYVAAPAGPLNLIFGNLLHERGIYRQQIIWAKDQFVMGRSDYHYRHEPVFYGWVPGAAHHALADRTQDTVWEIPRPKRSTDHPTMKPVELVERSLRNSTSPGELVGEPCGGSGTTLIAAHITGRTARVAELDPKYCDVIARRYQELTGDRPVLERTGEPVDLIAATAGARA